MDGERPVLVFPHPRNKSIQEAFYIQISKQEKSSDIARSIAQKLCVTLGESVSSSLRLRVDWLDQFLHVASDFGPHVRTCVLKTWAGGWTTSYRMHEDPKLKCLFGCDERDDLEHYLVCAPLWLLASEVLESPAPFEVAERICLVEPSGPRCLMLSLCFQGYHYAKSLCKGCAPQPGQQEVQRATLQAMHVYRDRFTPTDNNN